jgi:hypothetical protein
VPIDFGGVPIVVPAGTPIRLLAEDGGFVLDIAGVRKVGPVRPDDLP